MAIVLVYASPVFNYSAARPIYLSELSNAVDENLFATGDTSYCGHNDVSAARILARLPVQLWIVSQYRAANVFAVSEACQKRRNNSCRFLGEFRL